MSKPVVVKTPGLGTITFAPGEPIPPPLVELARKQNPHYSPRLVDAPPKVEASTRRTSKKESNG